METRSRKNRLKLNAEEMMMFTATFSFIRPLFCGRSIQCRYSHEIVQSEILRVYNTTETVHTQMTVDDGNHFLVPHIFGLQLTMCSITYKEIETNSDRDFIIQLPFNRNLKLFFIQLILDF